jgi:hypothetical protein
MPPRLTKEQRLIIYRNAAAGAPKSTCDAELRRHGYPPVHEGSYAGNLARDGVLFRARPDLINEFANGPMKYGDWPEEWKAIVKRGRRSPR